MKSDMQKEMIQNTTNTIFGCKILKVACPSSHL